MKIVSVDNFDREIPGATSDDKLVAENLSGYYASVIVEMLNKKFSSDRYYRVAEDDYKLCEFGP